MTRSAKVILDQAFLETRARLLDIAANLDRLGRAPDADVVVDDPRLIRVHQALEILLREPSGRAEAVQQLFSLDYDPDWPRPTPRS